MKKGDVATRSPKSRSGITSFMPGQARLDKMVRQSRKYDVSMAEFIRKAIDLALAEIKAGRTEWLDLED